LDKELETGYDHPMKINNHVGGPKPTDAQIKSGWPWMCFLYQRDGVHRAVALGLAGQWEDRGVTEADLFRLKLIERDQND
jgi:hypothetical protein